jgi:hypothetical protein
MLASSENADSYAPFLVIFLPSPSLFLYDGPASRRWGILAEISSGKVSMVKTAALHFSI